MKAELFVVFDKLAKESGPVFMAKNGEVARRQFENLLASDKALAGRKEEYMLYCVGSIDNETMEIVPCVEEVLA